MRRAHLALLGEDVQIDRMLAQCALLIQFVARLVLT
jgi:hypothetical protein